MTVAYESDWCHGNVSRDIVPKVCLTIDEAKRVADALWVFLPKYNARDTKEWLAYQLLNDRITKVEKHNENA